MKIEIIEAQIKFGDSLEKIKANLKEYFKEEERTEEEVETLVDEYLANNKELALQGLNVTTLENGLRFYTDEKSLLDLMIADRQAELLGATDEDATEWKTVAGIKVVTIKDIRDAIALRLNNKAKIVGVI